MDTELRIFGFIQSIILIIILIFALIYSIPIICIRRFHHNNNILTINVCVATILCCLSWLPIYAAFMSDYPFEVLLKIAFVFNIAQTIFTIQVPFSFVIVSIHRYCSIVYHTKIFFKRKRWIILCIISQWLLGFILTLPNFSCSVTPCDASLWPSVYGFVSTVIVPSIICFIINTLIYYQVRSSSRRIQPQNTSGNVQQAKLTHRDIYLLRHMVLMFCIFIGGWAPIFILPIISYYTPVNIIVSSLLTIWCDLALLFDMIDLYLYNHEVRKYLKDICLRIVRC